MKRRIAKVVVTGDGGYKVCPPGESRYTLYFSTKAQLIDFANEMGWKLKTV